MPDTLKIDDLMADEIEAAVALGSLRPDPAME
jgi:hypothetical protein